MSTTTFLYRYMSVPAQYFNPVSNLVSITHIISYVQEEFISKFVRHITNACILLSYIAILDILQRWDSSKRHIPLRVKEIKNFTQNVV